MASKNEFVFDWHIPYDSVRTADIFYCDFNHNPIVTISFNNQEILIACDGVMRIVYNNPNGGPVDIVKNSDKLSDIGINNDSDYANALCSELYEFDNQPWFDAYDLNDVFSDSMNMVEGDLDDIILDVMRYLLQFRIY